jgi:hypothetical protein
MHDAVQACQARKNTTPTNTTDVPQPHPVKKGQAGLWAFLFMHVVLPQISGGTTQMPSTQ